MGGNLNQNAPGPDSSALDAICDTDEIQRLLADVTLPLTNSELCDCQYCRAFARYARTRNTSALATIDLYSLPDEDDSNPSSVN